MPTAIVLVETIYTRSRPVAGSLANEAEAARSAVTGCAMTFNGHYNSQPFADSV